MMSLAFLTVSIKYQKLLSDTECTGLQQDICTLNCSQVFLSGHLCSLRHWTGFIEITSWRVVQGNCSCGDQYLQREEKLFPHLCKLKSKRLSSQGHTGSGIHRHTHVIQPPLVVFPHRRQELTQTDLLVII